MGKRVGFILTALILLFSSNSFAQEGSDYHSKHGFLEPKVRINLLGGAYNPTTENWGWYMGTKVLLFHPTRSVWMGGVGFGIAFDQSKSSNRGPVFVATFVPLEIGRFSVEASLNRIESIDNHGSLTKSRLVILAWNW